MKNEVLAELKGNKKQSRYIMNIVEASEKSGTGCMHFCVLAINFWPFGAVPSKYLYIC